MSINAWLTFGTITNTKKPANVQNMDIGMRGANIKNKRLFILINSQQKGAFAPCSGKTFGNHSATYSFK